MRDPSGYSHISPTILRENVSFGSLQLEHEDGAEYRQVIDRETAGRVL